MQYNQSEIAPKLTHLRLSRLRLGSPRHSSLQGILAKANNDEKPSNRPENRLLKGVYTGTKSKVLF